MTIATELDPFEAAVAKAMGEPGEGSPDESAESSPQDEGTEPVADSDQAVSDGEEQSGEESVEKTEVLEQSESEESEELFEDVEVDIQEGPQVTEEAVRDFLGIDESVDLEELKNGGLRQADYTRKTQELAAQRSENEKALKFWEVFTSRPQDVARQLAEQAGLIEPGAQPVKVVDMPFRSEEDIEAEVQQRVEERLAEHPVIKSAQEQAADRWIDSEFARIEKEYLDGNPLGPQSRQKVLAEAHRRGTTDLEGVFAILLQAQQAKQAQKKSLTSASPNRPTGKGKVEANTEPPVGDDAFEQAVEMAMAEISSR